MTNNKSRRAEFVQVATQLTSAILSGRGDELTAARAHDCPRCGEADQEDVVIEHRATQRRAGTGNMWPRPGIAL